MSDCSGPLIAERPPDIPAPLSAFEPPNWPRSMRSGRDQDKARTLGLTSATGFGIADIANVETGFGTPVARGIGHTTTDELRRLSLPSGSMGPKVDVAAASSTLRASRRRSVGSRTWSS